MDLLFDRGAFVLAPGAARDAELAVQARFLELVDRFAGQPLSVVNGPTYAPRVFAEAIRDEVSAGRFAAAMRSLLAAGTIEVAAVRAANRKPVKGIRRAPEPDPAAFDAES